MSHIWKQFVDMLPSASWQLIVIMIIAAFIGISGAIVSRFKENILCYCKAPGLQVINRLLVLVAAGLAFFVDIPKNDTNLTDFGLSMLIFVAIWFISFTVLRLIIGTIRWVLASL